MNSNEFDAKAVDGLREFVGDVLYAILRLPETCSFPRGLQMSCGSGDWDEQRDFLTSHHHLQCVLGLQRLAESADSTNYALVVVQIHLLVQQARSARIHRRAQGPMKIIHIGDSDSDAEMTHTGHKGGEGSDSGTGGTAGKRIDAACGDTLSILEDRPLGKAPRVAHHLLWGGLLLHPPLCRLAAGSWRSFGAAFCFIRHVTFEVVQVFGAERSWEWLQQHSVEDRSEGDLGEGARYFLTTTKLGPELFGIRIGEQGEAAVYYHHRGAWHPYRSGRLL
ncbi:unnamed protein product [Effrenium voratum]|uniref:Uncharacterized protein n=1 Tax=Effrenium voratum TaxID=2562239 RepID=A0AA36J6T6_9DINO|nr:unnamed protein product [Effrenium voratum]CAJ1425574.1 unnamed protein product [Effrenium voratum]